MGLANNHRDTPVLFGMDTVNPEHADIFGVTCWFHILVAMGDRPSPISKGNGLESSHSQVNDGIKETRDGVTPKMFRRINLWTPKLGGS